MTSLLIMQNLLKDAEFFTKVYPNLNPDTDFETIEEKITFKTISHLFEKYNKPPNIDELILFLETGAMANKKLKEEVLNYVKKIKETRYEPIEHDLLIDTVCNYIKNIRHMLLIEEEIKIREGTSNKTLEDIQSQLLEILQLSFSSSLGHDYIKDALARFEEYGKQDERLVSSGISIIDSAGGGKPKTLTVILASSNVGKCWSYETKLNIYVDKDLKSKLIQFLKDKGKL